MSKKVKDYVIRYAIFLIGLFINAFGVSFITKAALGTSPISSIPYVCSLNYVPTIGVFTIYMSVLLIALQIILLRKNYEIVQILQIPISIAFGYFIDATMVMLENMNPESIIMKFVSLLVGCIILGFGVYLEVLANVLMLPGEGFVRAVTQTFNTDFGITKVIFDLSMTISAAVISFVFFSELNGVGIGTIISAAIVGLIAKFFGKKLSFVKEKLCID